MGPGRVAQCSKLSWVHCTVEIDISLNVCVGFLPAGKLAIRGPDMRVNQLRYSPGTSAYQG